MGNEPIDYVDPHGLFFPGTSYLFDAVDDAAARTGSEAVAGTVALLTAYSRLLMPDLLRRDIDDATTVRRRGVAGYVRQKAKGIQEGAGSNNLARAITGHEPTGDSLEKYGFGRRLGEGALGLARWFLSCYGGVKATRSFTRQTSCAPASGNKDMLQAELLECPENYGLWSSSEQAACRVANLGAAADMSMAASALVAPESVAVRPLTASDLGVRGAVQQLEGTFSVEQGVARVRVDMIRGRIENPLQIIRNLESTARASGARSLRIEGTLANPRLYDVLTRRYGLASEGATDTITIPLQKGGG